MIFSRRTCVLLLSAIFFLCCHSLKISRENYLLVSTFSGKLEGTFKVSPTGKIYKAYEGIPFAQPPIGSKRFEPPSKVKPWRDIILTNKLKKKCIGYKPRFRRAPRVEGSEDCLYLNVYVPERKSDYQIPVIVYIYGGAFQVAGLDEVEEKNFMDRNVIFITFNYRSGIFGFLSTEDDIVPGNMGLKDQSMALKWIKDNIKFFGGDENKITIVGSSSGGVSVHYHYLSPMSRGLFRNGISISGTALMPWAQTEKSREKAIKLGQLMNCTTLDIRSMIQCLKTKPSRHLVEILEEFRPMPFGDLAPFGPVVEKILKGAFINRTPVEIIKNGEAQDLPWITTSASEEGLLPVAAFINNLTAVKELDENWEKIAPVLLLFNNTLPKSKHSAVAKRMRKYYLGNKSITKENYLPLTYLIGDRNFKFDSMKAAKLQAKFNKNPVWYYHYLYRAKHSFTDLISGTMENFGTAHTDDNVLIFAQNIEGLKNDLLVQRRLINIWVSVACTGQPTSEPRWKQLSTNNADFEYLEIAGPENVKMKKNDLLAQNFFWESINFNENI